MDAAERLLDMGEEAIRRRGDGLLDMGYGLWDMEYGIWDEIAEKDNFLRFFLRMCKICINFAG